MDEGESVITMLDPGDYSANVLLLFENGKAARLPLSVYATKTNRKKLVNAFSDKSPLVEVLLLAEEKDIALFTSDGRAIVFNSSLLQEKSSRSTQGVAVMAAKARRTLSAAKPLADTAIQTVSRYRVRSLPASGALLKPEDRGEKQLSLIEE
jgi:DNA gyrase subunit A